MSTLRLSGTRHPLSRVEGFAERQRTLVLALLRIDQPTLQALDNTQRNFPKRDRFDIAGTRLIGIRARPLRALARFRATACPLHLAGAEEEELRDIGAGGFLADTTAAVPVDSVHHVRLVTQAGTTYVFAARCAHCRRRSGVRGAARFSVGFAFTTPNAAVDHLLDQLTGSLTLD